MQPTIFLSCTQQRRRLETALQDRTDHLALYDERDDRWLKE
jgi:hypothetical protein